MSIQSNQTTRRVSVHGAAVDVRLLAYDWETWDLLIEAGVILETDAISLAVHWSQTAAVPIEQAFTGVCRYMHLRLPAAALSG